MAEIIFFILNLYFVLNGLKSQDNVTMIAVMMRLNTGKNLLDYDNQQ